MEGGMTKFNVKFHAAMYRLMTDLAERLEVPMADVIRESLSLYGWMAREYRQGSKLLIQRGDEVTELVIPSLERLRSENGRRQEVVAMEGSPSSWGRHSKVRRRSSSNTEAAQVS